MDEQQPWFKALPEDLQQAVLLLEGQNGLAHTQAEVSVRLFGAKGSDKRSRPMRLVHAGGAGLRTFLSLEGRSAACRREPLADRHR